MINPYEYELSKSLFLFVCIRIYFKNLIIVSNNSESLIRIPSLVLNGMVENCSHPTCYKANDKFTMYVEKADHNDKTFTVCGKHADFNKVTDVIVNNAASEANKEILNSLQE